jgi:DNA-binding MurR/RpiR family transcriptional regulator
MTAKHEKLLAALLTSPTIQGAAKVAGISEATALRYLKEAEFAGAYREARREVVSHAVTQLQSACGEAVATLREVASDTEALASSRVSAAKAILETSLRAVEIDDLAARVEALESQMEQSK